jgi:hypothetical protein
VGARVCVYVCTCVPQLMTFGAPALVCPTKDHSVVEVETALAGKATELGLRQDQFLSFVNGQDQVRCCRVGARVSVRVSERVGVVRKGVGALPRDSQRRGMCVRWGPKCSRGMVGCTKAQCHT